VEHVCVTPQAVDVPPGMSPKRLLGDEQIFKHEVKRQVQVLELPDIQKEFELVNARLRLVKHSPDLFSTTGKLILCFTHLLFVLLNDYRIKDSKCISRDSNQARCKQIPGTLQVTCLSRHLFSVNVVT
jgi:hypothetical protein